MPVFLAIVGGITFGFCQWLIYFYAPQEMQMGMIQKIFYMHLPLAWWALVSFFIVFIGSTAYIFKRRHNIDNLCGAAAEIGVLCCGLALISGMIWAKKAWGVWWTWDPRLTTTLILWFIYAAYLLFRNLEIPPQRRSVICAVIGIIAFLDAPLVFFSARIFRSIHPAVLASDNGGLEPEMKLTLFACLFCFGLIWAALLLLRWRQLNMEDAINQLLDGKILNQE